jgi:ATP-binding cassette subfamily C protein
MGRFAGDITPADEGSMPEARGRLESYTAAAMRACTAALLGAGLTSALVNLLYLTGSFFMLEVYDRVLPSQSIPTLIGLGLVVVMLYAFQGFFDVVRSRLLIRTASSLVDDLSAPAYRALVMLPQRFGAAADAVNPMRNLDQVRTFLSGAGPTAFFDVPWIPFYLAICFLVHPLIGWTATAGAVLIIALALITYLLTRKFSSIARDIAVRRQLLTDATRRNFEVMTTMGLRTSLYAQWSEQNKQFVSVMQRVSDVTGGLGAVSKVLRLLLQSAVLAVGAYLVIMQQASAGVIIASSILSSRAMAPVELAVANWQSFVAAREAWKSLGGAFKVLDGAVQQVALPAPISRLTVEQLMVVPPGGTRPAIRDITFTLVAGAGLGVIGASASGKSSLMRAIAGAWLPTNGVVRLDGAVLSDWHPDALGQHIGYLPQAVEMFAGSVAQNIARFAPTLDSAAIIKAARLGGVHEMILGLPGGYEAQIGDHGGVLSAGQRQRLALARALYADPFLLVLDEPNSNLDMEGEAALTQAILGVRNRGGIVVVAAHRPSALAGVNLVLTMYDGRIQSFGPRDEILAKIVRPAPQSEHQPTSVTRG